VLNFMLFAIYDYYFYASSDDKPEYPPIKRWVFAVAAFNIFMAYTLGMCICLYIILVLTCRSYESKSIWIYIYIYTYI